jgi:hypothetical protein
MDQCALLFTLDEPATATITTEDVQLLQDSGVVIDDAAAGWLKEPMTEGDKDEVAGAFSDAQTGNSGEVVKMCNACKQLQKKDGFSNKQWKEKAALRRCRQCIDTNVEINEDDEAAQRTSPTSMSWQQGGDGEGGENDDGGEWDGDGFWEQVGDDGGSAAWDMDEGADDDGGAEVMQVLRGDGGHEAPLSPFPKVKETEAEKQAFLSVLAAASEKEYALDMQAAHSDQGLGFGGSVLQPPPSFSAFHMHPTFSTSASPPPMSGMSPMRAPLEMHSSLGPTAMALKARLVTFYNEQQQLTKGVEFESGLHDDLCAHYAGLGEGSLEMESLNSKLRENYGMDLDGGAADEEEMECEICFLEFDALDGRRRLLMRPCGHRVCSECLDDEGGGDASEAGRVLVCPYCGEGTAIEQQGVTADEWDEHADTLVALNGARGVGADADADALSGDMANMVLDFMDEEEDEWGASEGVGGKGEDMQDHMQEQDEHFQEAVGEDGGQASPTPLTGYIFLSNNATHAESYKRMLFGAPRNKLKEMQVCDHMDIVPHVVPEIASCAREPERLY